jgi:LEA14-like dessication related protein
MPQVQVLMPKTEYMRLTLFFFSVIVIALFFYVNSYSGIVIERVDIGALHIEGERDWKIPVDIMIKNEGAFRLPIDGISYQLTSAYDGSVVYEGYHEKRRISPEGLNKISIDIRLDWRPVVQQSWKLYDPKFDTMILTGTMHIADFGVVRYEQDFRREINISAYNDIFREKQTEVIVDAIMDSTGPGVQILDGTGFLS